jgi:hypothetical protein
VLPIEAILTILASIVGKKLRLKEQHEVLNLIAGQHSMPTTADF